MGNEDLKEEVIEAFLIALDEGAWTAAMKSAEESGDGKPLQKKKLFNKSNSPLYPEEHGPTGVIDPESESGQKQQAHIRKQIDSSGKKGYHYGYEGSSGSEDEGGVKRPMKDYAEKYAKEKGVEFSTGTLEDPRTDIEADLRSTKMGRFLIKKYGPEQAEAMKAAYLADEDTEGYKAAYGQEDYPEEKQTPRQARFNQAQQIINRLRRHGAKSRLKKAQKGGKMVGGGWGAGHFTEQFRNSILNYLDEGPSFGDSPTQTGARVGRAMTKMYSEDPSPEKIQAKRKQAKRIMSKVGYRQVQNRGKEDMLNREGGRDTRPHAHQVDRAAQDRFRREYTKNRESFEYKFKNVILNYLNEGSSSGENPMMTGGRVGNFMAKLKRGEVKRGRRGAGSVGDPKRMRVVTHLGKDKTDQDYYDQIKRIKKKTANTSTRFGDTKDHIETGMQFQKHKDSLKDPSDSNDLDTVAKHINRDRSPRRASKDVSRKLFDKSMKMIHAGVLKSPKKGDRPGLGSK